MALSASWIVLRISRTLLIPRLLPLVDESQRPVLVLDVLQVLALDEPDGVDVVEHNSPQGASTGLAAGAEFLMGAVPGVMFESDDEVGLDSSHPVLRRRPEAPVTPHAGELAELVQHPPPQKLGRLLERRSFQLAQRVLGPVDGACELNAVTLDSGHTRGHGHQSLTSPVQISSVTSPRS